VDFSAIRCKVSGWVYEIMMVGKVDSDELLLLITNYQQINGLDEDNGEFSFGVKYVGE
jgi:hypothetical protein